MLINQEKSQYTVEQIKKFAEFGCVHNGKEYWFKGQTIYELPIRDNSCVLQS